MEFKIKTLTPVHVGSGSTLSPYGDYIKDNNYIYIIDYSKLEKYLRDNEDSEAIIDEFVSIINKQASSNKSKRYTIKNFFKNNDIDFKEFSSAQIKLVGNINNEEINQTMKTSNRPIIPGSTVKGAIRTALLFNHLIEDGYNINRMKRGYIGGEIFGRYGDDKMKYLHVSDSSPLNPESMVILHTNRWNLIKNKTTIPIIREAVDSGKNMNIRIQSKAKDNIGSKLSYLIEGNENLIIDKVNNYTKENLKKEIKVLKKHGSPKLNNIISKYNDIYNRIEEIKSKSESMILRVGAGKTYFDNSIANIFSEDEFKEVRKKAKLGKGKPFPRTRSVVTKGSSVVDSLGWIELSRV